MVGSEHVEEILEAPRQFCWIRRRGRALRFHCFTAATCVVAAALVTGDTTTTYLPSPRVAVEAQQGRESS
jgi:hypothetical protein